MNLSNHPTLNIRTIIITASICLIVYLMLYFEFDLRAITIITVMLGYITNVYAGLMTLIGLLPLIGPLIVKVLTIPVFWIINSLGYITSAIAIKKGYGKETVRHRVITLSLLIGIIIGYVLGHLMPVR